MKRKWKSAVAVLAAVAAIGSLTGVTTYAADSVSITNVSYDPTRELYEQYNKIFQEYWNMMWTRSRMQGLSMTDG